MYAAFDAVASAGRAAALASYNGKVLRLNTDGTTPQDQPGNAPVFAGNVQSPRGLDWHPATAALWVADVSPRDVEEVRAVNPGQTPNGRARIPLPAGTGTAAVAFYRGTLLPAFTGGLFVAAQEGRYLLRLQLDTRDPTRVALTERLLQDVGSPIRAVSVAPDGLVYVATDRTLLRLGPR